MTAADTNVCRCRACTRERDEETKKHFVGVYLYGEEASRMILCEECGNKRCPHANDHRHACTGSNATGQPGSYYP